MNWIKLKKSIQFPLVIVAIWVVIKLFELIFSHPLSHLGILPRSISGLQGILFSPFLHGDWHHLFSNLGPFLVLTTLLLFFYPKKTSYFHFFALYLFSGCILWLIGRSHLHIGASGLIYALASFLIFKGIFSNNVTLLLIAILTIILYGGILWGIFPCEPQVSWEGHLSGAVAGFLLAFWQRKQRSA